MNLLDLIFPKYCINCKKYGEFLCANCLSRVSFDTKNICLVCGAPSYNGLTHPRCMKKYCVEGSFTAVVFNAVVKKLIYQFKYTQHLTGLKSFLRDLFYESLIQYEEFEKILNQVQDQKAQDLVLVSIPLSTKKFKKRG